jgi:two-component system, OmpR family, sensor kinase
VKLSTRISLFFLAALGAVLLGMSACIFFLVRTHEFNRLDEATSSALDELTAAVEFGPEGLEWESGDRQFTFNHGAADLPIAWAVFDLSGQELDRSREVGLSLFEQADSASEPPSAEIKQWKGDSWRIVRRILRSASDKVSDDPNSPPPANEPEVKRYRVLVIAVAVPAGSTLASMRILAISLLGSSLCVWVLAAVGGHWLAAKSLAPLTQMAHGARTISAADLDQRLPSLQTGDELEDLNSAFNGLLGRLQESFQRQRQFSAEASHQLRTPLAALLGQIDVALRRGRQADEYRQALVAAHRQADRLSQIVDSLLFLTREDRDAAAPVLEPIEVYSWLNEHVQSWQEHARFADLQYVADPNGSAWIKAQNILLGEALDNLFDNACKYSAPGTKITIEAAQRPGNIAISVADSGFGISPDDLQHIFQPFVRGQVPREKGIAGAGLGLAVVRRIVTLFDGQVEVTSTLGVGAQFTLIFPIVQHSQVPNHQPEATNAFVGS